MRTPSKAATLGIVAGSILFGMSVRGAEANVDWTNRVNVSVSGNVLQITAGDVLTLDAAGLVQLSTNRRRRRATVGRPQWPPGASRGLTTAYGRGADRTYWSIGTVLYRRPAFGGCADVVLLRL